MVAREAEHPVRAWLSGIDGSGSRASWILFEGGLTAGWSDAYEVDFTQGGGGGDRPIVLVRIDQVDDQGIVRQVLRAHEYWRLKGLALLAE